MKYIFVTTGDLRQLSSFIRLKYLGQSLAKLGIDVYYLCDDTIYNRSLIKSLDCSEVILIQNVNTGMSFRPRQIFLRRKQLKTLGANILHFLNPSLNNTFSIAGLHKTIIISDWDELLSSRIISLPHRWANRLCESIARQQADLITVSSRHLQNYFQDKYNCKSLYLPYATYLENVQTGASPFSHPTAVYLGNLHQDGDHDILIDAWTILESQGIAPPLCMIGGGPCLDKVKADVGTKGMTSIDIRGYLPVEEMWTALCHAHILLFPIRDTIGNRMRCPSKTFAYMQSGRPIVTCRVGEVAEALGEQGIYVDPIPEAFAQKIIELFSFSLPNISYDLDRHQWENRAKDLLSAIQAKL